MLTLLPLQSSSGYGRFPPKVITIQGKCSDSWDFEGDLFTMSGYQDFWQYISDPTLYSCNSCRDLYWPE